MEMEMGMEMVGTEYYLIVKVLPPQMKTTSFVLIFFVARH